MEMTTKSCWDDTGKLLLRITIGGLMLFHGIFKFLHGIDKIIDTVKENGCRSISRMAFMWAKC